jgi:hypothetical protein
LSEYGGRNYPNNARELFNLRYSSLRVTVERTFGALKGRFHILDNKSFHTYRTQVNLVLACCIMHNWILGFGTDEIVPLEEGFVGTVEEDEPSPSDTQDSGVMISRRDAIFDAMWSGRGTNRT